MKQRAMNRLQTKMQWNKLFATWYCLTFVTAVHSNLPAVITFLKAAAPEAVVKVFREWMV
jgi:hypothetical protein